VASRESDRSTVHVVEDHPLYRAALRNLIEATPDLNFGVCAESVEELAASSPTADAVVTLDLRLRGVSDTEAVSRVARLGFRVLVISAYDDDIHVRSAMAAGARGYVTKHAVVHEILRALRTVSAGGRYLPPRLAARLSEPIAARLSNREQQVLALLAGGARDQDIADELKVSVRTVRSHLDRIREKTGRRRRPDLTRLAMEKGIVAEHVRL